MKGNQYARIVECVTCCFKMDLEGFSVEVYANALTKRDRKEQLCKERMMSIVNVSFGEWEKIPRL